MKLVLREYVKGLGEKNDVVAVKNGYGRNFLIPQGLAVVANSSNIKVRNEDVKQAAHKQESLRAAAQGLADQLAGLNVQIEMTAGENGKIFGSVTSVQVADALMAKGIDIDRRKIFFDENVRNLGAYDVTVDLHKEVKATLKIEVVSIEK